MGTITRSLLICTFPWRTHAWSTNSARTRKAGVCARCGLAAATIRCVIRDTWLECPAHLTGPMQKIVSESFLSSFVSIYGHWVPPEFDRRANQRSDRSRTQSMSFAPRPEKKTETAAQYWEVQGHPKEVVLKIFDTLRRRVRSVSVIAQHLCVSELTLNCVRFSVFAARTPRQPSSR